MISLIAAIGKNRELGKNNHLLWNLKGDMKYFKETTLNSIVVMGRKTYESIGRPLPNRDNIVITRQTYIEGVQTINNPNEVLKMDKNKQIFIIGGASIYEYFLPYADKLYLTLVDVKCDADVFFPSFKKENYEKKVLSTNEENGIKYSFVIYTKKNNRKK